MVKSVLGVSHQGLRQWVLQRLTALYMTVFVFFMLGYFIAHPNLTFVEWHGLFTMQAMKIATILLLVAIVYHTWIGIWTIVTDYVKCFVLRSIIHTFVLLSLLIFLIAGVMILWSV